MTDEKKKGIKMPAGVQTHTVKILYGEISLIKKYGRIKTKACIRIKDRMKTKDDK